MKVFYKRESRKLKVLRRVPVATVSNELSGNAASTRFEALPRGLTAWIAVDCFRFAGIELKPAA